METSLKVIEQKEIPFYDDELIAVRSEDGKVYVSVRHLCEALGLDRRGQVRRLQRNEILTEGYKGGVIMSPPSPSGVGGGRQRAGLLRVDLVPLWLSGIDTKRVKDEIRPKLKQYQREAATVLWEAFQEGRLTAEPSFDDLLTTDSPAAQAYKMAQAIMALARQQLLLESKVVDHENRLERIEATLGDPGRHITPDQASQISQAVKAIAMVLSRKTRKNEYGGVYGELYRREGVTGYKLLPAHRFESVMQWLTNWHKELTDGADVPF